MKILNMKNNWLVITLAVFLSFNSVAQTCNERVSKTTPNERFTINGDGTVTDKNTGLQWMRCSLGETWNGANCDGERKDYTWQDALIEAKKTSFAGFSDWVLPNVKELASIIEEACFEPAINPDIFPTEVRSFGLLLGQGYWSSTKYEWNFSAHAIYVSFDYDGRFHAHDTGIYKHRVRLIRYPE